MCSIAKDAERKHSAQELLKTQEDVEQLIINNQYHKEKIKEIHNQKRIDDEQAQLENSRI